MNKSKSWLKSLLIVLMAVILVFTLVACNKDDDNGGKNPPVDPITPVVPPNAESASDFFTALWNSAKPIGGTAIGENKDIAIDLGMEASVNTIKEHDKSIYQHIDLGFEIQAVLGRSKETTKNTALKIKVYDPTDTKYDEIITLYAFADDLDVIYIDFADKNIKLPHDMANLIWGEVLGKNKAGKDDLGSNIIEGLNNKFLKFKEVVEENGEEKEVEVKKSINDIIEMFAKDFGENWSINSVLNNVLNIFNLDLTSLIKDIGPMIGIKSVEELLDDNGNLDLLPVLQNKTVSNLIGTFIATYKNVIDENTAVHKAVPSDTILGMLKFSKDNGKDTVPSLQEFIGGDAGEFSISFTETNNKIKDLTVYAKLGAFRIPTDVATLIPELSLKINKFSITPLAENKSNGVQTKVDRTKYSDMIAFEETITLEGHGITMSKVEGFIDNDVNLNGNIVIKAVGQLDIVNTTNNKTRANLTVTLHNDREGSEDKVLAELGYANGKIVGKLADAIEIEGEQVIGFVYDLNKDGEEFNFATMVQNFVKKNVTKFIEAHWPNILPKEEGDQDAGSGAATPTPSKLKTTIEGILTVVLPMFNTDNHHYTLSTDNILKTIVDFKEVINPGDKKDKDNPIWKEDNRIIAVVNALLNPPCKEANTAKECLDIIKAEFDLIMAELKKQNDKDSNIEVKPNTPEQTAELEEGNGEEGEVTEDEFDWKGSFNTIKDATLKLLYICAQNVRIKGVETEKFVDKDYAAFDKKDLTDEEKIYINNIKAVLGAQIKVEFDLQEGIHSGISINIADATLSASHSFELIDVVEVAEDETVTTTFTDLYELYKEDIEKEDSQWMKLPVQKADKPIEGEEGGNGEN